MGGGFNYASIPSYTLTSECTFVSVKDVGGILSRGPERWWQRQSFQTSEACKGLHGDPEGRCWTWASPGTGWTSWPCSHWFKCRMALFSMFWTVGTYQKPQPINVILLYSLFTVLVVQLQRGEGVSEENRVRPLVPLPRLPEKLNKLWYLWLARLPIPLLISQKGPVPTSALLSLAPWDSLKWRNGLCLGLWSQPLLKESAFKAAKGWPHVPPADREKGKEENH